MRWLKPWCFILWLFPFALQAHVLKLSDSELKLSGHEAHWNHRVHLGDFDVKFGRVGEADLKAYLPQKLGLSAGGIPCQFESLDYQKNPAQDLVTFQLVYRCDSSAAPVKVHYDLFYGDPSHRHLIKLETNSQSSSFTFDPGQTDFELSATRIGPRIWSFFHLGLEHILIGYDHILFVLALILGARRFADLLWLVTTFTLAHSITLALATLHIFSLPPSIVEPAIAASILFLALLDLAKGTGTRRARIALTFAFGLVHGLGFSYILQEAQLEAGHLAIPLIFFNLGVEAGQLLIVALVYPLTLGLKSILHRSYRYFRTSALCIIAGFGLYWLMQRV